MEQKPLRLYFICIQNRCRSQIAEAFARHYGGDRVIAESAGINHSDQIHPLVIAVMNEVGIDVSSQVPKKLQMKGFMNANVVVKTCDRVNEKCPVVPFGIQNVQWEIPDPIPTDGTVGHIEDFRATRDRIRSEVLQLLKDKRA